MRARAQGPIALLHHLSRTAKHNPDRTAVRHGHEQGSVTFGGRRLAVQRPRVGAADGSGELPVAAYELFSSTELLGRLALKRMLGGLSTRRYPVGLEPVGTKVEQAARGATPGGS
jgi:putative transposase